MAKTTKLFSKIIMIGFLVLIVLGFSIPGFINNTNTAPSQPEPRLCKSDADCYLICDERPLATLCLQNLCQQNQCGDSYFEYDAEHPVSFMLEVVVNRLKTNLTNLNATAVPIDENINLAEKASPSDFFVKFEENGEVKSYSPRLSLSAVLSKAGMILAGSCLRIDSAPYCQDESHSLNISVNGEEIASPELYIPNEGDEIEISYG